MKKFACALVVLTMTLTIGCGGETKVDSKKTTVVTEKKVEEKKSDAPKSAEVKKVEETKIDTKVEETKSDPEPKTTDPTEPKKD